MKFVVTIKIITNSLNLKKYEVKSYYEMEHFDIISYQGDEITITGSRNRIKSVAKIINNASSTIYRQILKSLVFQYLINRNFEIKLIAIRAEKEEQVERDIVQPFTKTLEYDEFNIEEIDSIFGPSEQANEVLTGILYYIQAVKNNDFGEYWKSFNRFYAIIGNNKKDFENIKAVREFIEDNKHNFSKSLSIISAESISSLRKLRIREYILNTYPNENSMNHYVDMINRFTDYRIIEILYVTIVYRKEMLENQGLYNVAIRTLSEKKQQQKKDDVEVLCFCILKYGYFLRNKYFHAEKANPYFLLKESTETLELEKICELMRIFLGDLIRCNTIF